MRTSTCVGLICVAFVLALSCAADAAYTSEKPVYAAVVLNATRTKVLALAFDESRGTGTGYDLVYADMNLNGRLDDEKPVKGTLETERDVILSGRGPNHYTFGHFPAIELDVPYNERGRGIEKPCKFTLHYSQFYYLSDACPGVRLRRPPSDPAAGDAEEAPCRFHVSMSTKLKDSSGEWEYSLTKGLRTFDRLSEVRGTVLLENSILELMVKPDSGEGQLAIAALLIADEAFIEVSKGGQPATARVEIRDGYCRVIHAEDVSQDSLVPG